jgi:lipopolysaccharide export LptBFGC system permease protein LptF
MPSSPFEITMLVCFGTSWPVSIAKALRTHVVKGKSPVFLALVFIGYISGILHKALYTQGDPVIWLYVFNAVMVGTDWCLYMKYRARD